MKETTQPILIRIGGSVALLNDGARPLVIKLLGSWLYDCYQEYPVLLAKGSVEVSELMCLVRVGVDLFATSGFPSTPHPSKKSLR
jgi:hypothetical protein